MFTSITTTSGCSARFLLYFVAVVGDADHVQSARYKQVAQPIEEQRVIVGEQQSHVL